MSQSLKLRLIEKMEELQILLFFDLSFNYKRVKKIFSLSSWKPWNAILFLCAMLKFKFLEMNAHYYSCLCTKRKAPLHEQFFEHITPMEWYFFKTQKLAKELQNQNFVDHKIRSSLILSMWNYWKSIFELCPTDPPQKQVNRSHALCCSQ